MVMFQSCFVKTMFYFIILVDYGDDGGNGEGSGAYRKPVKQELSQHRCFSQLTQKLSDLNI